MALPPPRDPELTRRRLATWLAGRLDGAREVSVSEVVLPTTTGFSNETIAFDASWRDATGTHHHGLVARVEPTSHAVFPDTRFDDQARILEVMATHTEVPVPRIWFSERDPTVLGSPFLVMDRIAGRAPDDNPPYTTEGFVAAATPLQRRRMWDEGLAVLPRVAAVDLDLVGFLGDGSNHGGGNLAQRLGWWHAYHRLATGGAHHPVLARAGAWLDANLPDREGPHALCWGDARLGNQLFSNFGLAAVLDWEMVHVGDPVWDLAWFVWLNRHFTEGVGAPRPEGFPSDAETIAAWEAATGRTVVDFAWHQVLAGYAFAAIMVRLAHLLVGVEVFPQDSDFAHTNPGVTFLDAELDRLAAHPG